jgi:hypothetical protein
MILSVPAGPPFPEPLWNQTMCAVVWCYSGPLLQADAIFRPIRTRFGTPALDWVGPLPYPALQSMFDAIFPFGIHMYWKADFVKELPEASIAQRIAQAQCKPVGPSLFGFHPIDGAAGRIAADATAWSHRGAKWAEVMVGVTHDPAEDEAVVTWARETWSALHPYSAGGAYVNFMMEEGDARIQASYGPHYERLAGIKARYDPDNLFRVNQNIQPRR